MGHPQVCRDATQAAPCYPGTFTGDCKTYNKSNCGVQYSDQQNAAYCAIDTPSTWPPLLQVSTLPGATVANVFTVRAREEQSTVVSAQHALLDYLVA
jgi:hypothetical protein